MGSTQSTWGDRKVLKTKINMPRGGEICFEAPEINMASDIVLDARVSIVTVAKVVASALERFEFNLHGRNYLDCWTFINCFASQNIVSTAFIWLAQRLTAYF